MRPNHNRSVAPRHFALLARASLILACFPLPGSAAPLAPDGELVTQPSEPLPDGPLYAAPTTSDRVGRIMAPVMVNGMGPFFFIVDTGASRSAISPRLAARLGLTPSLDSPMNVQGSTGSEDVPTVRLQRLQTGDIVLDNRRFPVVAPHVFANADGILGMEGFNRMRITVDFGTDRIKVSRSRPKQLAGTWYRVPVKLRFGGLMVTSAMIGHVRVLAIIDTGAERSLGNLALRSALRELDGAERNAAESQVTGATAGQQSATTITSPLILLGETALASVDVTFADLNVFKIWGLIDEPALVVGMDVLGTARALLFDYRRSELMIRLEGPLLMRKDNG